MDSRFKELRTCNDVVELKGLAFEEYLTQMFTDLGCAAHKTKASGDFGGDLILQFDGRKVVVQAKSYKSQVKFDAIKEVVYAKQHYNADEAWVVAPMGFTSQAHEAAHESNIRLLYGQEFEDLMRCAREGRTIFDSGADQITWRTYKDATGWIALRIFFEVVFQNSIGARPRYFTGQSNSYDIQSNPYCFAMPPCNLDEVKTILLGIVTALWEIKKRAKAEDIARKLNVSESRLFQLLLQACPCIESLDGNYIYNAQDAKEFLDNKAFEICCLEELAYIARNHHSLRFSSKETLRKELRNSLRVIGIPMTDANMAYINSIFSTFDKSPSCERIEEFAKNELAKFPNLDAIFGFSLPDPKKMSRSVLMEAKGLLDEKSYQLDHIDSDAEAKRMSINAIRARMDAILAWKGYYEALLQINNQNMLNMGERPFFGRKDWDAEHDALEQYGNALWQQINQWGVELVYLNDQVRRLQL